MTSPSAKPPFSPKDVGDYAFAHSRFLAFEAVTKLWRKRQAAGMKQSDIADFLGRDRGWVSRSLRGPGNWTMRTLGELVEALNGELEIATRPREELPQVTQNSDAYAGYDQDDQISQKFNFREPNGDQKGSYKIRSPRPFVPPPPTGTRADRIEVVLQ